MGCTCPASLPGLGSTGSGRGKLAHQVRVRSPRRCKMVHLSRGGLRPQVYSCFSNMIKTCLLLPENTYIRFYQKPGGIQGFHVSHPQTLNLCLKNFQNFFAGSLAVFHMPLPGRLPWIQNSFVKLRSDPKFRTCLSGAWCVCVGFNKAGKYSEKLICHWSQYWFYS